MTPSTMIESVHIRGFRSLADVELSGLPGATVLIGPNGSGKSNFIRFFEMLSWMLLHRQLGDFIARQGGADDQLFGGNRLTPRMEATIRIRTMYGRSDYRFSLSYGHPDRFIFSEEAFRYTASGLPADFPWQYLDSGHREAKIVEAAQSSGNYGVDRQMAWVIVQLLGKCHVFQFHDTSASSNFKNAWDVSDCIQLRSDGGNLAAVLYGLEQRDVQRYELICRHIGRVLPGFDRFDIQPYYGKVLLRWKGKWSDKTFGAHLTSDGSLRFFALVTLLNLPPEMLPDVILLDEPELGLHPAAVALVGGMIKSLAAEKQVIVATQSPLLVDSFNLDEIFVLDLEDGRTKCNKLNADDYGAWLEDNFTPGELWQKNLLGGRP